MFPIFTYKGKLVDIEVSQSGATTLSRVTFVRWARYGFLNVIKIALFPGTLLFVVRASATLGNR